MMHEADNVDRSMTEERLERDQVERVTPVSGGDRIHAVDVLRGFAVFGILVVNMYGFAGLFLNPQSETDFLDRTVIILVLVFAQAKFYSLFSMLFGWGLSIQMERALAKGIRFVPLYLRRTAILLLIGVIHGIFLWSGDILTAYAVLATLLLLFRKRSKRVLLIGVLLLLTLPIIVNIPGQVMDNVRESYARLTEFMRPSEQIPQVIYGTGSYWEISQRRYQDFTGANSWFVYWFGNVFAMFMLGFYIGKRRLFHDVKGNLPLIRRVMWSGLVIGLLFNAISVWTMVDPQAVPASYQRLVRVGFRTIGAPALMLFYVSAILLLLQKERWRERLIKLAPIGRMALTNYLSQSVIVGIIFYGYALGLYGEITPTIGLLLTFLVYWVQIRFSAWWMERFRFGPMEWLWRSLTYLRFQPMRRGATEADLGFVGKLRSARGGLSQVNPLIFLSLTWTVLLAWAVGLVAWNAKLAAPLDELPFEVVSQATATPRTTSVQEQSVQQQVGQLVVTPEVQPVEFRPGAVAETGDMNALAYTISGERALEQIAILAGPTFDGRLTGSAGGRLAGDYIADQFEQFGLRPAGDGGSFFQSFPVTYTTLAAVPSLTVTGPDGNERNSYVLYEDYSPIVISYMGEGLGAGEVYWVNRCQPDDFKDLDVVGKIILCHAAETTRGVVASSRQAVEYGAAGMLLLTDPEQRPPDFGNRHQETWVSETIPSYRVYPTLAEDLLAGSGMQLVDLADDHKPFLLETKVEMVVTTTGIERYEARNVLGVLPGRDPSYSDEIIIIGAHYDHLGTGPDGTLWGGANDNASGTAVVLEVARSWYAEGYVPRRTVLFAAWDAEEWGLLGSEFYVQNPRYPLESTLATIQMDMVGTGGETLSISGARRLSEQLLATAQSMGIEAEIADMGRSDHVPFNQAGVPSSLLIWHSEGEVVPSWHRPMDLPRVIEAEKLEAAATIAGITLLDLAESEPAINAMLLDRATAATGDNLSAFLATSTPNQAILDRTWFADLRSLDPTLVEIIADELRIDGSTASAEVQIKVEYEDETEGDRARVMRAELPVRFIRIGTEWRWAGPNLVWASRIDTVGEAAALPPPFAVAYPPDVEEDVASVGQEAAVQYSEIAQKLGLPDETDATLYLHADSEALRVSTALSLSPETNVWVEAGTVKLIYSPVISRSHTMADALARLLLANAGLNEETVPWLWHGLPLALRADLAIEDTHRQLLPVLESVLEEIQPELEPAGAWAAVEYFKDQAGWDGLGRFIASLGRICIQGQCDDSTGLDLVLGSSLGMDSADFALAWKNNWRERLDVVQTRLDDLLAVRVSSVLEGDEDAFIRTVDPGDPLLVNSERSWFADLSRNPVSTFELAAIPVTFYPNGDILAKVTIRFQLESSETGQQPESMQSTMLFTESGLDYRWAGIAMQTLTRDRVTIRFPEGESLLAETLLVDAEEIYAQLAETLEIRSPDPVVMALFPDGESFRASIGLSFPNATWLMAWSEAGTGVKIRILPVASISDYYPSLARQLGRHLLYQLDIDSEWLLSGISDYLTRPFDGGVTRNSVASRLPEVLSSVEEDSYYVFANWPAETTLSQEAYFLARAQAWDGVRYLVDNYGWRNMIDLLHRHEEGASLESATQAILNRSPRELTEEWASSLTRGHADFAWLDLVDSLDGQAAKQHVDYLAGPDLAGRQAGTPGDSMAAEYIAERFAEYGLIPAGDEAGSTFYQVFPISYTVRTSQPVFEIAGESEPLVYQRDFLTVRSGIGEDGAGMGDLVWINDMAPADVDLTGKIIVRMQTRNVNTLVTMAVDAGAEGLILLSTKEEEEELFEKQALSEGLVGEIPVIELTVSGGFRVLDLMGESFSSAPSLPSVYELELSGRIEARLAEPEPRQTANVLGILPGSDPGLRHEVIVLGAHYDHVGDDPDGTRYAGANDNASGVGLLLEIARLWHHTGYLPKRSVLFAAWGAQELGQLGSATFTMTPTIPFNNIIAALQMDGVGGGGGFHPGIQGIRGRDGLLLHHALAAADLIDERVVETSSTAISDHLSFSDANLPSILLNWRLASERNLPDDLANSVSPERLELTGRIAALTIMMLAQ